MNDQLIKRRRFGGFTLIEVIITVAIVAILTVVAVASYRGQAVRSNRAAAASFMLEVANKQEQYLLDRRNYAYSLADLGMSMPSEVSDNYTINIVDPDTGNAVPEYQITMTPTGSQANDDTDCGWLRLNSQGNQSSEHSGSRCWK